GAGGGRRAEGLPWPGCERGPDGDAGGGVERARSTGPGGCGAGGVPRGTTEVPRSDRRAIPLVGVGRTCTARESIRTAVRNQMARGELPAFHVECAARPRPTISDAQER